ncbi:glutamyl-tRNA(Gln) amidotransferase subunit B, mitochondrial [Microplitis mediator]|uniref:glutamyl-tRNA(Gln) amidotransferase subunit B, mitochondrial n=1 Tax=Microplitis mediator TaxID=375433 RepID=UPI0025578CE6|nr:glutamyl-tRNA(Gln) amidotransferase subunit B, mitochondrial [Microplitis mediator]XP_057318581.1 glutamyl-tRNA(Gln) amidotransferase subunit B, mitochondrial [Microplitis mediator]
MKMSYSKLRNSNFLLKNVRKCSTNISNKPKKWNSVVGLEIHAQISSDSKLFSGASTAFGKPVNSCVSFFDCATPGTLPVLNRKCVEAGILTALALSCQINEVSLFDRKHYFYADLPAGYQITQQRQPLAVNGSLKFNVYTPGIHKKPYEKVSKIKQLQLEQDSGKSLHDSFIGKSLVDLNRAGVPLMELVFEPDLADGEEAAGLVKELMNILQRLDTCSCKMEEGALRVDANVSVNRQNESLGTRTEIKNIGSVRAVAAAIQYEIKRQINLLERGEKIVNETLSWDAENSKTVMMRDKEEKQDYRFMPEPNLPPLRVNLDDENNKNNLVDVRSLKCKIPRLPDEIRKYFIDELKLIPLNAIAIVNNMKLTELFEDIMAEKNSRSPKNVSNILLNVFMEFVNENNLMLDSLKISSKQLGQIVDLLEAKRINLLVVPKILSVLIDNPDKMPEQIVQEFDWAQIDNDEELIKLCQKIFEENPKMVTQFKNGKAKVLKAMLGAIAKKTNNRANMQKVSKMIPELLKND